MINIYRPHQIDTFRLISYANNIYILDGTIPKFVTAWLFCIPNSYRLWLSYDQDSHFSFQKKKWLTLISFASIEFSSFSFSFSSKIWPHRTTWFSDSTSDSILNEKVRILLKLYWIWFSHCGDYELPAYGQTMESQLIIFRLADAFTFLTFECVVCIAINEQNDQSKIEKDSRRATFFIG